MYFIDHTFAVHPPELHGAQGGTANTLIATTGGTVWKDRDYTFGDLPGYIEGEYFFQTNVWNTPGTSMDIKIYEPCIIYITWTENRHGGTLIDWLANDGWTEEDGETFPTSYNGLDTIWKKTFATSGLTTIDLPTLTEHLLGVVFATGNRLKIEIIS